MNDENSSVELDLAAENERLKLALQAAELGTWDYNLETGEAEWSASCKQLFGLPANVPVTASMLLDQVHPDDREWVGQANIQAVTATTDWQHNITFRIITVLGQRWIQAKGRTFVNEQGKTYRFAGIAQDVTAVVESRQQYEASQERFRNLIEEAPVATCLFVGRDLKVEVANEIMLRFWGKDNAIMGKPLVEAVPELIGQPFLQILDEVYTTGKTHISQNTPARLPSYGVMGTYYFDFTYKPLINAQGEVYAVLDMAVDVTERVLSQQRIEVAQKQILASFEQAPVAIAIISEDNLTFQMVNPFYAVLVGRKTTDLVGMPLLEALPELDGQGFDLLLKNVIESGTPYSAHEVPVELFRHDQLEIIYVDLTYQPQRSPNSEQVTSILVVATDVTQQVLNRKRIESSEARYRSLSKELETRVEERTQELTYANHDLKRSNDNLQQFAYIASHDLQEPLRKIQAFSSLLHDKYEEELGTEGKDLLQRITSAGARMSTLIKDLLTYSRIETRKQGFSPISLADIVSNVLNTLEWEIEQRGAIIEVDKLPIINGDDSQLSQLFQNLLSNALKFTIPGNTPHIKLGYNKVAITELPAAIRPSSAASEFHQISVCDQGIGFDEKYLDRIFLVFQRLHGKNEFQGTGVGLAICQRVVENHGGALTAISKVGEGATFYVYLPV